MYCHKEQIIKVIKNMMHTVLKCYDYTLFGSNMVVSVVMKRKHLHTERVICITSVCTWVIYHQTCNSTTKWHLLIFSYKHLSNEN